MSAFLEFLNTASAESLSKTSGISPSLAESLVAARPFDSIEDCLNVRGMGRNLLARAQAAFDKSESEKIPEEHALVPVEEQDMQTENALNGNSQPPKEIPQEKKPPSSDARLGRAFLWFFRALLRLILIILIIGGIGAAIYYGAPFIRDRFIAPVEQNSVRVLELENETEALQARLDQINDQLTEANEEIDKINDLLDESNGRMDALETSVDAHTATLAKLAEMQAALETELESNNNKTLLVLKQEVMLTRILDMLARARLYLAQSNFGLAQEDVQSARDLLAELQTETNDEAQFQALERLDLALNNLPGFPVVASGDLEIAWQILMTGEPVVTATPEAVSSPTVTPVATLTATPTP